MRLSLVTSFLISICSLYASEQWLEEASQNIDPKAVEWTRELLRKESECVTRYTSEKRPELLLSKECKNCLVSSLFVPEDPKVLIFISFSVPTESWLALSNELSQEQSIFVIRGLPHNSFQELSKRILQLKIRGFDGTIQIDPLAFQTYAIDTVPTFVVRKGDVFDKVQGNITLSAALSIINDRGETSLKNISGSLP